MRAAILLLLLAGCAAPEPRRVGTMPAPWGAWGYCIQHPEAELCRAR